MKPTLFFGEYSRKPFLSSWTAKNIWIIHIIPEIKLRGLVPNFHIHTSLSDLYISYVAAAKYADRACKYINCSQIYECRNWDWGRAVFPVWEYFPPNFRYSIFAVCYIFLSLWTIRQFLKFKIYICWPLIWWWPRLGLRGRASHLVWPRQRWPPARKRHSAHLRSPCPGPPWRKEQYFVVLLGLWITESSSKSTIQCGITPM